MEAADLILVSVDDHVVEPPHLFDAHIPARLKDRAPKLVRNEDGSDVWSYDGRIYPNVALNAVAGRPPAEYGMEPTSFDELRAGTYDVHARIKDMNANGVLGSMCFPSFPQFCGQVFARTADYALGQDVMRAYNDWHIDEWCGTYPGRFIPLGIPGLVDPEDMATEVRRLARKGCHAVTFSENPVPLGYPSLHSDHWDPFWKACADEGTMVCLHIGSSSTVPTSSPDAPIDVGIVLSPVNLFITAADLVYSPALRKFPDLRFALSEGGIGWIPYFLERLDYSYLRQHQWTGQDFGDQLPSELFRERIVTCFIDDAHGIASRELIGIDNITWECDYPHSDANWPMSPEWLMRSLEGVPDDDIDKITHLNAMRHFRYDPFAHRPRERCTVEALRTEAVGWDVGIVSHAKRTISAPAVQTAGAFAGTAFQK